MQRKTKLGIILALSAFTVTFAKAEAPATSPAGYSLTRTIKPGGDGRWDYVTVDPESHLLYVTRSNHMQVINPTSGAVVADIADLGGTHGVALAPKAGRGFISDGKSSEIVVFDIKTNAVLGKVAAADDADGIIYDSGSNMVLMSCGDAKQLVAFPADGDVKTAKATMVDLGGKPEFLAADGAKAYVTVNDTNEIAVVDLKTMKVAARWPIGDGTKPTGMSIDPKNHHLFVGCRNQKMIVMNAEDGKVLADLPIGKGNDACGFDEGTGEAFASCGDSTVTVIKETSAGKFEVTQTIATKPGARTMTIDSTNHTLYLPTAEFEAAAPGQRRPNMKPNTFMILVVEPAAK